MRYNGHLAAVRKLKSEPCFCAEYDSVRLLPNPEGEGGPVDDLLKTRIEKLAVDIHQCAAMCDSFKKASFLSAHKITRGGHSY